MKKNILGFVVFSLIFLSAAFVYKNLNRAEIKSDSGYANSRRCIETTAQPGKSTPFISQAVLDVQKQIFYWELSEPNNRGAIKLNFFVKAQNGTRYISSSPLIRTGLQSGELSFESRLIDKLHSDENLYVAAEAVSNSEIPGNDSELDCTSEKAVPVLIFWGR